MFDAQVKPMLLYTSEIWGITRSKVIESAHLFACKRILGVSDRTPNQMAYGDTGRFPLFIDSTISSLKYWLKIKKMTMSRFPKQIFSMQIREIEAGLTDNVTNWANDIRSCLLKYGFLDAWENGVANESLFISSIKAKMIEEFHEDWISKVFTSDRFATYRIFKTVHEPEGYLNDVTIKKFRDTLVRFRFGINELGINKRYKLQFANKNCPFCPAVLEDEYHVLFHCPVYYNIRNKYAKVLLENSYQSINYVMLQIHAKDNRNLAMFIYYALKHREEMENQTS